MDLDAVAGTSKKKKKALVKLQLEGTPRNIWNVVAASVDTEPIEKIESMVEIHHMKCKAEVDSLYVSTQHGSPQSICAEEILGYQGKTVGLQCKKCKQYDVTYKEKQDRGADEGMTAYCRCRTCGHEFRLKV